MVPGHADGAVTVHLGLGRRVEAGRVGAAVGFNAYMLRTADAPYAAGGTVTKTGDIYDLCVTKVNFIEHRGSVRAAGPERQGVRQGRHLLAAGA